MTRTFATKFVWLELQNSQSVLVCSKCGNSSMIISRGPLASKGKAQSKIVARCVACSSWDNVSYGAPEARRKATITS